MRELIKEAKEESVLVKSQCVSEDVKMEEFAKMMVHANAQKIGEDQAVEL